MLGGDVNSASHIAGVFKFEKGDSIHLRSTHAHVIDHEFGHNQFGLRHLWHFEWTFKALLCELSNLPLSVFNSQYVHDK